MGKVEDNKLLVINFLRAISNKRIDANTFDLYVRDPLLIKKLKHLDSLFPNYKYLVDEATAEADRVVVRGRIKIGEFRPSITEIRGSDRVEIAFVYGFRVLKTTIIDHWLITDGNFFYNKIGPV